MLSTRLFVLPILICLLVWPSGDALAQTKRTQEREPVSLDGRHTLSFGFGLLPNTSVGLTAVSTNGMVASFSYAYGTSAEWSLEANASILDAEVNVGTTSSVAALLFGAQYSPEALAVGSSIRPYLGAAVGPYVRSESGVSLTRVGAQTQSVLGGRLSAGLDAYALGWLRLGLRAAYHVAPQFEDSLGNLDSASGGEFSLNVGVSFGG
ncbi:MAG: hypothetical protein AAGI08_04110 [Bacteroidota bacterium]